MDLCGGRRGAALRGELSELEARCLALRGAIDPYCTVPIKLGRLETQGGAFKPLNVDRLSMQGHLGRWDAQEFLSPQFWLPYQEPALLRRANPDPATWSWPRPRPGATAEELCLFRMWDAAGILELSPAGDRSSWLISQVFNTWKDERRDRQILDRRGPNGAEAVVYPGPSRDLPAGAQLAELLVDRGREDLRRSGADRKDFYHQFQVTAGRAASNACGTPHPLSDFKDFPSLPVERYLAREADARAPR